MKDYKFIAIEGNIGAGKTTLARSLARRYNGNLILEKFRSNPFLTLFYEQPEKFNFQVETTFLLDRFRQLYRYRFHADKVTFSDYFFSKCIVFSGITLKGEDYKTFNHVYQKFKSLLPVPDLYVYLHSSSTLLLKNINKRRRPFEQNIQRSYLEKIEKMYLEHLNRETEQRTLIINTNDKNFVNKPEIFQNLTTIIFNHIYKKGITQIEL